MNLFLNVDIYVNLNYPDWMAATKAPTLEINKDIDFWMIFMENNNIYFSNY